MAEISKKKLNDKESQNFLESQGFVNICNSFSGSSWKKDGVNIIFNLSQDRIIHDLDDIYDLFYEAGFVSGQRSMVTSASSVHSE